MEIKKYVKKIISSNNDNKINDLVNWICKVLEDMDADLEEVERMLYEISEGRVLNEERAQVLINNMKPFGMK